MKEEVEAVAGKKMVGKKASNRRWREDGEGLLWGRHEGERVRSDRERRGRRERKRGGERGRATGNASGKYGLTGEGE